MKDIAQIRRENTKVLIEKHGLSRTEFAEKTGVAYSQLANYIGENPTKNIGRKVASRIESAFNLSENWLDQDWEQGEMTAKPTIDELRLKINKIRGKVDGVEAIHLKYIYPVINEVQAGNFTDIGDDSYDEYRPAHHKGSYWLKIKGDSMTPEFRQGDLVLVDKERIATTGNYVVALIEGDAKATFKKYRECFDDGKPYYQLIALNDFYPIIDSRAKPFEVIGVVVEHNRGLV